MGYWSKQWPKKGTEEGDSFDRECAAGWLLVLVFVCAPFIIMFTGFWSIAVFGAFILNYFIKSR